MQKKTLVPIALSALAVLLFGLDTAEVDDDPNRRTVAPILFHQGVVFLPQKDPAIIREQFKDCVKFFYQFKYECIVFIFGASE